MKLLMYGVNKETVMKEDLNKYLLNETDKKIQMVDISKFEGVQEIVILTDDFRNEYYLYVDEEIFSHGEFLRYIAESTAKTLQEVILETYSKFNEDVLRHLFEYSAGYLSDPTGSFEELWTAQETLNFTKIIPTSGPIIFKMFKQAISIGYALKLMDEIQPLNQSRISQYIYLLKEQMPELSKKNYLVSGNDLQVYFLAKLLLFAGAQTVTVIQRDEAESQLQYERIVDLFNESERARVFPMTAKSLFYRLSKADAGILDSTRMNIFENRIREEVSIIRQTKKVQYVVDTAEKNQLDLSFSELDLQRIDGTTERTFNKEEQEKALMAFDEVLTNKIEEFMTFLQSVQADEIKEMTW